MYTQHLSSLEFFTYLAFFAIVVASIAAILPGRKPPVRTQPYPHDELTRHEQLVVLGDFNDWFWPGSVRSALSRELPAHGLLYVHLPRLGGRRRPSPDSPNGGWNVEAFRGYADYMASIEFATGVAALQALARQRTTAMMCAEGLWWRCHRRLISDVLTVHGWNVVHILPDGGVTTHELTPFAVLAAGSLTYPSAQASLGSSRPPG